MARAIDRGRANAAPVVGRNTHDSFHRDTHWRLDKRLGDVDAFTADRRAEALHVLAGGRAYGDLSGASWWRFTGQVDRFNNWLAGPKLSPSVKQLWTPDRVVDQALHELFVSEVNPYEVVEVEGNLLVTVGIAALLNLLIGDAETAFSNANAHLGVGDSSTAAAVGQTDLQAATNKLRKAMNATYPIDSAPTIDFQSTFGSSEANFAWQEVGTFNAASAGDMLNRVVQSLGTKTSGATWTLTETITWS